MTFEITGSAHHPYVLEIQVPTTRKVTAKPAIPAQNSKPGKSIEAPAKTPKVRVVHGTVDMPETDHARIAALKNRALAFDRPTKKSELFRAGLQVLQALNDKSLKALLNSLPPVKSGRHKKR